MQPTPKLIRWGVLQLGAEHGVDMTTRRVRGDELLLALAEKHLEESAEAAQVAALDPRKALEEAADAYEVLRELVWALGFTLPDLHAAVEAKRAARGPLVLNGEGLLWSGDPAERW